MLTKPNRWRKSGQTLDTKLPTSDILAPEKENHKNQTIFGKNIYFVLKFKLKTEKEHVTF